VIRTNRLSGLLCLLLSTPLYAAGAAAERAAADPALKLQAVGADMTVDQYRQASHSNQQQIRHFVESYSENTLLSLGVPKTGINLIGAVAGAAVTQNATVYLNDQKSFAIDIKDAAQDDRAIYFGYKLSW